MDTTNHPFRLKISLVFAILAGTLALSTPLSAAQVYTWTDENGVVHFVDQPPENADAVSMDAPEAYRPGSEGVYNTPAASNESPAASVTGEGQEEPLSYADQQRQEIAERRAEQQKKQAERARECATAEQRLAKIEPNRRVFYTDDSGETVRMDDEERVAEVQELHDYIDKNCQ